ncbi:MAG: type IX secretion system membrane protein PorP/SprF [Bacteroidia bacterium]|nr:MAG: type IX secretion system membrane protein PorP/SprF [Bacteroidia bacterium]
MMKKPIFSILLSMGLLTALYSQSDPVSSQYMFNHLLYNPGSAGSSGMICATAMTRQQWVGLKGAPSSTVFHVNAAVRPLKINSGIGLTIINDKAGFDTDNSLMFSYSYIAKLGQGKLGIGVNLGMLNKAIDPTWNIPSGDRFVPPSGDPLIPENKESYIAFDMGLGLFYSTQDYYAGLSVTHLTEPSIKYTKGTPYVARQYYATAGYTVRLPNPSLELIPSLFVFSDGKIFQPTVTALVRYNKKVWGGVSYRTGDALSGIIGVELYNGLRIGYSYDFPMSDIKMSTSGSHEFVVNYCFDLSLGRSSNRYKSIRFL